MGDIHFHVLVDDFIECRFRHRLDGLKRCGKVHAVGKRETSLGDVLCADLTREIVKSAENVAVYLLKALHTAGFKTLQKTAPEEFVSLLAGFPVNRVVRIKEPVEESQRLVAGESLGKCHNSVAVETVRQMPLPVWRQQLEPLTLCKEFSFCLFQTVLQNIPVVSGICTCTYCRDDIDRAKPPFRLHVVPDGADLPVVEESDGNLLHTEILLTN